MKILLWLGVIFFCTNVRSQLIQLGANNISQYLQNHVAFIRFYSDWCPHSKKFEPTWKRFADMKENSGLRVAQIDCSDNALLCSEHDVFGYPTMKLFVRGSGARYEGPRHIESLETFYQQKVKEDENFEDTIITKTLISELTGENFAQFTSKGFAFVMFFAPWCKHCKILMPIFQELAKQMHQTDGLIFATVDCTLHHAFCSKHAIQGYPTLVWYENGHERERYTQSRDVDTMRLYIEEKMKDVQPIAAKEPTIQTEIEESVDENLKGATVLNVKTFTQGVSFEGYTFVNFGAPWCSHCQKLAPIWDRLAQKFADVEEIRIARVDCTASESICRDYGIRAFPTLILFRYGESKVEYNGVRDLDSLYQFLLSQVEVFGDNYLLKSETEPTNE